MKIIKRISKTKLGQKTIGFLVYLVTKLVFLSISWKCEDPLTKKIIFKKKKSYIFCCWHNKLFVGPYFLPLHFGINALQSSHSDGMMTAILFNLMKINIIFGSSMKGGTEAFIKMIKSIKKNECIAITPDGPKGPKYKVKDGIIKLAQITGTPIVPLVWTTKNKKTLNSWDNFEIPYPFSSGAYIFGQPIHVKRDLDQSEFLKSKENLENKLNCLTIMIEKKMMDK